MTALPTKSDPIVEAIDAYHETRPDELRLHLGCSIIGHDCERWIWLSFRWAVLEYFDGRMRRLFRRGHHEESWVLADLRATGMEIVAEQDGHQLRVDWGGHMGGSMDGLILRGVPQAPTAQHVLEIKTHSKKSFDDLVKNGVRKSKPQHWAQMQSYMRGRRVERALYVAACKDDDQLYTERVRLDKAAADELIAKGERLSLTERLPEPCSGGGPSWYKCKWCAAYDFCWGQRPALDTMSCRTCAHVTPQADGSWRCERWAATIPQTVEAQLAGCPAHVPHPELTHWPLVEPRGDHSAVYDTPAGHLTIGEDGITTAQALAKIVDADCPF